MKKETKKRIYNFLWKYKMRPPGHLIQLSILKGGLVILGIDTQLKAL